MNFMPSMRRVALRAVLRCTLMTRVACHLIGEQLGTSLGNGALQAKRIGRQSTARQDLSHA